MTAAGSRGRLDVEAIKWSAVLDPPDLGVRIVGSAHDDQVHRRLMRHDATLDARPADCQPKDTVCRRFVLRVWRVAERKRFICEAL
jgi:hypothetical protein